MPNTSIKLPHINPDPTNYMLRNTGKICRALGYRIIMNPVSGEIIAQRAATVQETIPFVEGCLTLCQLAKILREQCGVSWMPIPIGNRGAWQGGWYTRKGRLLSFTLDPFHYVAAMEALCVYLGINDKEEDV